VDKGEGGKKHKLRWRKSMENTFQRKERAREHKNHAK
jgi:hypothetical protein